MLGWSSLRAVRASRSARGASPSLRLNTFTATRSPPPRARAVDGAESAPAELLLDRVAVRHQASGEGWGEGRSGGLCHGAHDIGRRPRDSCKFSYPGKLIGSDPWRPTTSSTPIGRRRAGRRRRLSPAPPAAARTPKQAPPPRRPRAERTRLARDRRSGRSGRATFRRSSTGGWPALAVGHPRRRRRARAARARAAPGSSSQSKNIDYFNEVKTAGADAVERDLVGLPQDAQFARRAPS